MNFKYINKTSWFVCAVVFLALSTTKSWSLPSKAPVVHYHDHKLYNFDPVYIQVNSPLTDRSRFYLVREFTKQSFEILDFSEAGIVAKGKKFIRENCRSKGIHVATTQLISVKWKMKSLGVSLHSVDELIKPEFIEEVHFQCGSYAQLSHDEKIESSVD